MKHFYQKGFLSAVAIVFAVCCLSVNTNAQQVNYAKTATASHSGGGAGIYGPSNYNDGTISSTTGTPWAWIAGTGGTGTWMMYTWKSSVSINEWLIYGVESANRTMTAGEIQYWDGSSWKTATKFSHSPTTQPWELSVTFPTVTTTRMRLINMTISGRQASNPNFREIECYYNTYAPYDAGVASIDSPFAFCAGSKDIWVSISNFGTQQLDTVTVNWELDGVSQTAVVYTDTLDTAGGSGNMSAQVKLGSATFGSTGRTLKVWTSGPDNEIDTTNINDTVSTTVKSSLSGTFTIGSGANDDYSTFTAAIDELNKFGVCGAVVFNVDSGTYAGGFTIESIVGASSTNTIEFKGISPSATIITHAGTSTANMNTIELSGTDWVTFDNLRIQTTGSYYGQAIMITKEADHNTFSNCEIIANVSATSVYTNAIIFSSNPALYYGYGNTGNYNRFINNEVVGGYYGCRISGGSTSAPVVGNTFINNNFDRQYYYGFYTYYTDSFFFHDNVIDNQRNTYNFGLMHYFGSNFDIQRNYIKCTYYSALYYANYYNYNNTARSIFANNALISTGTSYTLYGYRMSHVNFWHNTLYGKGSYMCYWYYMASNDIRNNIFYYEGNNYCIYTYNPTFVDWDYNDYYLTSGNLAYISGSVYASISALEGYSASLNQNNWDLDPAWVQKDDDHHITTNFPNMFGPYVGVDEDIDGDSRCQLISTIGNDELQQSALPPTANFLAPDTAWLGSPTVMLNAAKPKVTEGSQWWVNGVMMSDSIHLEYTPSRAGSDTITLVHFNCSGSDTLTKVVLVSPILRAPEVDFSASDRDIYTGDAITLFDLSENGSTQWEWDITPKWVYSTFLLIRDRTFYMDSTKANPRVEFMYPGTYAVKLKVANSYGADSLTRTRYITVREAATMCSINNTTSADFGTVFDDGGAAGQYSAGLSGLNRCTYSISTCKGQLEFDVDVFDLNQGDYLKIYDGADATGKPLWDAAAYPDGMNGNKTSKSVKLTFTATTGSAYFDFETDGNVQTVGKGFAINWNVDPMTFTAPTADFSFPDTACVGYVTNFENTTQGVYSDVEWDVNADGSVEDYGETFSYTFNSTGTYDVQLKANSYCADYDSTIKQIVIINAAKAPTADFTATATKVNAGDTVSLADMSQYCNNFTDWEITPANYIFVNSTKRSDEMIDVVFTKAGFYTIELTKGNTFGRDSLIKTNYIQVLDYCTPAVANLNTDIGITRVTFNTIDNSSQAGRSGYTSYLDQSTMVERGLSYPISVERATTNNTMTRKVWIDWNIDGDFNDAGEMVSSEATASTQVFNDTITIPSIAVAGKTRMRVSTNYKNLQNLACGPHQFGEFEDYSVVISDEDNTAPLLTLSGALTDTIEVFSSWTEPGYTAIDLLDGDISGEVTVNSTLDTATLGTYTVTYSVSDDASNTVTETRTIVVVDTESPEITLNGMDSVTIDVNTIYADMGVTTSDNYDATLSVNVTGNVDTSALGEYTIEYCVTDASGNGPVCVLRRVFVQDTVAPVLALVGDESVDVEQCGQYTDAGYTVLDNGSYAVATSGTWTGDTKTRGTYTVVYTATDNGSNSSQVTRTINVVDTEAPTLEIFGNQVDTVDRWSEYTDAGYEAADFCNPATEVTVEVGGTFINTQSVGLYNITYQAEDASGNMSSLFTRYVYVKMPVGFGEYEFTDGFELFPNPTSGSTVLSTSLDAEKVGDVVVYNLSGQAVYRMNQVTFGTSTNVELDLSKLAAGTYHVQITGADVYTIKKLVISK